MDSSKAHALVCGIGVHASPSFQDLGDYVRHDAEDIRDALIDAALCGYAADQVHMLMDQDATLDAMRTSLKSLAAASDPDSTVAVFISTHGHRIEDGAYAGEYLCPTDVDVSTDEATAATAMSGNEFSDLLKAIPARKLMVVLDCCHAAGIGTLKSAGGATGAKSTRFDYGGLEQQLHLAKGAGRVVLSSSREDQYSYVSDRNSLYTKHLVDGLRGGAGSRQGTIDAFDLYRYTYKKVTEERSFQSPIFLGRVDGDFPVALYRGGTVDGAESTHRFDAYVSMAGSPEDAAFFGRILAPAVEQAGLTLTYDPQEEMTAQIPELAGRFWVENLETGIQWSKRTLVLLSPEYLETTGGPALVEAAMAQAHGIEMGKYLVIPVIIRPIDRSKLPLKYKMLAMLDLSSEEKRAKNLPALIKALRSDVPTMSIGN